jgi:hypothetical protein
MTSSNDRQGTIGRLSRRGFVQSTALGAASLALATAAPSIALAGPPAMKQLTKKFATESEIDAISDPALRAIAADTLAHAKYAFTSIASGKFAVGQNEFVDVFAPYVAGKKSRTKAAYAKTAAELLAAPQDVRDQHFGRYSGIAPAQFLGMDGAAVSKAAKPGPKALVSAEALKKLTLPCSNVQDEPDPDADAAAAKAAKEAAAKKAHEADLAAGHKYKLVELFISEVKCIENTGGLFEGTDEIALGGVVVGASGHTEKVKQFLVKEGFDTDSDHNTKKYKHGKRFHAFHIAEDAKEATYTATLAMAELDQGGFGDFIMGLWKKVKGLVVGAIGAAAGAGIAAAIGSAIPGLGTLIGAVVGAIIGWLVGLFHNDDDIVGHKTVHLTLHHSTKSYYDKKKLTTKAGIPVSIDFKDDGHYRLTGGWRLVAP